LPIDDLHRLSEEVNLLFTRVEELAALQSFPADFFVAGNLTEQRKQLCNAVPVELASARIKLPFYTGKPRKRKIETFGIMDASKIQI
jgi:hypothetical protein